MSTESAYEPVLPPRDIERDADWLAQRFHEVYEQMAPAFGYSTRSESAVPWERVPKRNKMLMRAVALVVEDDLRERIVGEVDVVATAHLGWLREHASDTVDRARLIGAEDAYRDAMNVIQKDPDDAS